MRDAVIPGWAVFRAGMTPLDADRCHIAPHHIRMVSAPFAVKTRAILRVLCFNCAFAMVMMMMMMLMMMMRMIQR